MYSLLNEKKNCSKCLVLGPGVRKNLLGIESHTTDTFQSLVQNITLVNTLVKTNVFIVLLFVSI